MFLENFFAMVGGLGTAGILFGMVAFVGFVPATVVLCPTSPLRKIQPRGR